MLKLGVFDVYLVAVYILAVYILGAFMCIGGFAGVVMIPSGWLL